MLVFSLNTIIGFACAINIDMGFNSPHHHKENSHHHEEVTTSPSHIHADGKKHHHETAAKHSHAKPQHHDVADNKKSKESKDDCCNDKVIKFEQLDKAVAQSIKIFTPGFIIPFLSSFSNINIFYTSYIKTGTNYFVRSYHPPIPDIRIAIQSFLI